MTIKERELANAIRFTKEKENFYEVYFIKWFDPSLNYIGWIRYTLLHSNKIATEAAVWGVFINLNQPDKNVAIKQMLPLTEVQINPNETQLVFGDSGFTPKRAWGKLEKDGQCISWDLNIQEDGIIIHHIPRVLYSGSFPRTKFVAPQCGCRFGGNLRVNEVTFEIKSLTALTAHFWGTKQVSTWAWANCINFKEDPEFYFDGVSARMKAGRTLLPAMTCLFFFWEGRLYSCNTLIASFITNKTTSDLTGWEFRAVKGQYSFNGKIQASPSSMLMYKSQDPDGELKYTHLTFCADMVIDIAKETKGGWKLIKTMTAENSCTYENAYEYHNPRVQWIVG